MGGQGSSELVEGAGLNVQTRGPYRRKGQRSSSQSVLWCESAHCLQHVHAGGSVVTFHR